MDLGQVIADRAVRTVFQPIVDLDTGTVVAYEALSRGPMGEWERPDVLFAAARSQGRLDELDALCRATALRSAVTAGIEPPTAVFVNVEPDVLDLGSLDELIRIAESAPTGLRVVLEITERAIGARPAELLDCVRQLRAAGWRIALDDVGADDMSLAFMPLLRPDIVKLDLKLVQQRPGPAVAGIMNAVNAYAETSGALVLAEGIEDEKHLEIARALGATLGQGWMFGRPAEGTHPHLPTGLLDLADPRAAVEPDSPFGCLPADMALRRSTKPLLVELSKHLEREALRYGSTCIVLATFQYARHFTAATAQRYRELAERTGFVAAIGEGLSAEPVAGVRGADIAADDALRSEWDLVVLSPHFSAALLARDLGDTGPDHERRFEFGLTYRRDTVAAAAEALLSRVLPTSGSSIVPGLLGRSSTAGGDTRPGSVQPAVPLADPTEAARLLKRALAATPTGVSIADVTRSDHPLIYVNTAFERLSGFRAEQILGTNCRILQGPDTDPAAVARIRDAIQNGRECRETILNYRNDPPEPWWNEIYLAPVFDADGKLVQYIGVQNDVTERVRGEAELAAEQARSAAYLAEIESMAFHDPLTGLLNRRRLDELLAETLHAAEASSTGVAFLYVDVDGFKRVNDTYGHRAGDTVLGIVADRLRKRLRHGDLVARLGGDEFLLVLPGLRAEDAGRRAEEVAADCKELLQYSPDRRPITVSIGTSTYPEDGTHFDALLHAADQRMYTSKKLARARDRGTDRHRDTALSH